MSKMFQATYVEIDNFRHWTEYPPQEEGIIQFTQLSIARELIQRIHALGGLFLGGRGDSYLALTNGIRLEEHEKLLSVLGEGSDVTVSAGVGSGRTFFEAQEAAASALHQCCRVQDRERTLEGVVLDPLQSITLLHVDANKITQYVERLSPLEVDALLFRTKQHLDKALQRYGTRSFLLSGDNYIAPIPPLETDNIEEILFEAEVDGISLKAGVGRALTPRVAANLSGAALKHIRENGYLQKVYSMGDE